MTVVLCDFNAKSINWCKADITSLEGSMIDRYYSEQLWLKSNLVMESGIYSSLHSICHHRIVFAEFNLSIFYYLPYERTVWYYERSNTELIRRKCY